MSCLRIWQFKAFDEHAEQPTLSIESIQAGIDGMRIGFGGLLLRRATTKVKVAHFQPSAKIRDPTLHAKTYDASIRAK